jgi:ribosomal-protein-alanine N-acetyltransferase
MESVAREVPGSRVSIEPASWRDLNPVRHLEQACFPQDAWPLWDVIGVLTLPNVLRLKAVVGGELAGFVAADIKPGRREAWIATIGVLPAYRRRGIGAALLAACEAGLKVERVKLCVRYSNTSAIRLYEQLGYTRTDAWRRYYADGEDAIVFEKEIGRDRG